MRIRNVGLVLLLSFSVLWAQENSSRIFGTKNRGISGRIRMSHGPSGHLRVELYLDMMLVATTITDMDGTFWFKGELDANRYEIRVGLGNGHEHVELVDFFQVGNTEKPVTI